MKLLCKLIIFKEFFKIVIWLCSFLALCENLFPSTYHKNCSFSWNFLNIHSIMPGHIKSFRLSRHNISLHNVTCLLHYVTNLQRYYIFLKNECGSYHGYTPLFSVLNHFKISSEWLFPVQQQHSKCFKCTYCQTSQKKPPAYFRVSLSAVISLLGISVKCEAKDSVAV